MHMGRSQIRNNFAMRGMCKCKALVHHLRSQIYILTLQQRVGMQIPGLFSRNTLRIKLRPYSVGGNG